MAQTCCTIIIPGPPGTPADPCTPCANGLDAFTRTTGMFTMPVVGGTADQGVANSSWACPGLFIVIQNLGYFLVTAVPNSTTLTVQNLGYSVNVAPGTIQGAGWLVLPTGPQGVVGPAGPITFQVYDTIAILRGAAHGIGYGAVVNGQLAAYDGQGGVYSFSSNDVAPDDGIATIIPNDITFPNPGRWRKVI